MQACWKPDRLIDEPVASSALPVSIIPWLPDTLIPVQITGFDTLKGSDTLLSDQVVRSFTYDLVECQQTALLGILARCPQLRASTSLGPYPQSLASISKTAWTPGTPKVTRFVHLIYAAHTPSSQREQILNNCLAGTQFLKRVALRLVQCQASRTCERPQFAQSLG